MDVTVTINGEPVSRDIEPRQLLVHFIRDTPGLTGTHWGCDTSNCGACVVSCPDANGVKSYQPGASLQVRATIMLVWDAIGVPHLHCAPIVNLTRGKMVL